jgi:anti-sigma B factor antagonist
MRVLSSTLASGIGLIEAKGSFVGGGETDELRQAIRKFVDAQCQRLVIDVSKITYINSTAVGILVSAHISYTRRHWQMKLCGVNKVVHSILAITKLNLMLESVRSCKDAIESFK